MAGVSAEGTEESDEAVRAFVENFVPESGHRVSFAWNGQHSSAFFDANEAFRSRVVEHVCANPGSAPRELAVALFRASAMWAVEAWGSPRNFERLAAVLLTRWGEDVLPDFMWGLSQSFDTFGACHQMRLDPVMVRRLQAACDAGAEAAPDSEKRLWDNARTLFGKLAAGTAREGWAVLDTATQIQDVRVVRAWSLWLSRVRRILEGLFSKKGGR